MNIYIFSDNKNSKTYFSGIKKPDAYTFNYFSASELRKVVKKAEKGSFFYVDVSGYEETERVKILKYLSKLDGYYYGIIDSRGLIKDVAELFHNMSSDYIGKDVSKKGISAKRLKNAIEYRSVESQDTDEYEKEDTSESMYILSGNDWKGIKSGQEYTFCFMFIELDNQKELKKVSVSHRKKLINAFHDHIGEVVSAINGKIWMWMDFGGLILLPFDGENCDAILTSFRLILSRKIISVEEYDFDMLLSYRIAIHIGNTVYKSRGKTGTIVSDSINSIFHLGQKFAEPGNFYLTENVSKFIPQGLEKCFLPAGEYEGREIMRMRIPL